MENKGQSAIEYLTTYGWMLLVIAIVGGAIFTTVQNSSQIQSTSGLANADVQVDDFGVTEGGGIQLELRGASQDQIENAEVRIIDENSDVEVYSNEEATIPVGDTETVSIPGVESSENTNTYKISIEYDTGGLENLNANGSITGRIAFDGDLNTDSVSGTATRDTRWLYQASDNKNTYRGDGSTPTDQNVTEFEESSATSFFTILSTDDYIIKRNGTRTTELGSDAATTLKIMNKSFDKKWGKTYDTSSSENWISNLAATENYLYTTERSSSDSLLLSRYDLNNGNKVNLTEITGDDVWFTSSSRKLKSPIKINRSEGYAINLYGTTNYKTNLSYIDLTIGDDTAQVEKQISVNLRDVGGLATDENHIYFATDNYQTTDGSMKLLKVSKDSSLNIEKSFTKINQSVLDHTLLAHDNIYLNTYNSTSRYLKSYSKDTLNREWTLDTGNDTRVTSGPSNIYGVNTSGSKLTVQKINPDTGSVEMKTYDLGNSQGAISPIPSYSGGNIYMHASDKVLSVNSSDLSKNWEKGTGNVFGPVGIDPTLTIDDGEILAKTRASGFIPIG